MNINIFSSLTGGAARPRKSRTGLVLVVCLVSSFVFAQAARAQINDPMRLARAFYLKSQFLQAVEECQKVVRQNQGDREVLAEANYFTGASYVNLFDFLSAKKNFKAIVKKYRGSAYYEDAYIGLGDIELLQENFQEAIRVYTEFLLITPSRKRLATLYFRLAEVNLKLNNRPEAEKYLDKLKREFPLSFEVRDARRLMDVQEGKFYTVQVGAFRDYENAERVIERLKAKDYEVYSVLCLLAGKKLCRIRVGRYPTRRQAQALEERLRLEGFDTKIFLYE